MPLIAQSIPVEWWGPIFFAALGSFSIGFLEWARVYQLPGPKRRPVKDPVYYLIWAIVYPVLAGGLAAAYLHSGQSLSGILAFQVGASAPVIIRRFAERGRDTSPDDENPAQSVPSAGVTPTPPVSPPAPARPPSPPPGGKQKKGSRKPN